MELNETTIHIDWAGPYPFDAVASSFAGPTDYGVYQIYGAGGDTGTCCQKFPGRAGQVDDVIPNYHAYSEKV